MDKPRALIVDDEPDIIEHVGSILAKSGFEVSGTTKSREALSLAQNKKPSVIILDICMPDLDGSELGNILQNDSLTKDIPIVYLTGLVTKDEFGSFERMGRNYVVAKPVGYAELIEVVNKAISGQNGC